MAYDPLQRCCFFMSHPKLTYTPAYTQKKTEKRLKRPLSFLDKIEIVFPLRGVSFLKTQRGGYVHDKTFQPRR